MNSPDPDEQLEADVYSNLPSQNDSSTGTATKSNRSSFKSKHSETEQRRRSKINERFQSLMDIIPQNDQKRDKASFLLEVIEYIRFLQDKVQMYEEDESHQMWYQPPTKLTPWRNNHEPVCDHPQVVKSFSSNHDLVAAPPPSGLLFSDMPDSLEPYIYLAESSKILEHSPIPAVSSCVPTQPLPQFVQHNFWQPKPCCESSNGNTNGLLNSDEKASESLSNACSQRVLHSLTEALESSGVDMSKTVISVKLNLRKRADREDHVTAFASEENCNGIADEQEDSPTETKSFCDLDHSQKRIRR
uniref:Transcription factor BIM3 n=1 Tax=Noccaea caerulescens TaxID=107243 RepID=A0A1J3FXY0_NOCCA